MCALHQVRPLQPLTRKHMTDTLIMIAFGLIVLVALIVGVWYLFRMWVSPDVERYSRMSIQGPFVPVDEKDIAERQRTEVRDRS